MEKLLDILASGIHETKNQLFYAETAIAAAEATHGIDLGEARYAIERGAHRLNRTLAAYRLLRHERQLALIPTVVSDLCAEMALEARLHLQHHGLTLRLDCALEDAWPMDRELVEDMLSNALQNASRFARTQILLRACSVDGGLQLCVADDGPGFASLPPAGGTGLRIAHRLAELHSRGPEHGTLTLSNGGPLNGACFTLWLP